MKSTSKYLVGILVLTLSVLNTPAHATRGIVPTRAYQSGAHLARQPRDVAPSNRVLYFGGPVISSVKVIAVLWGPHVDPQTQSQIGDFYKSIVNSSYMDWLKTYNTDVKAVDGRPGTQQKIGRGTFEGIGQINPKNTKTLLDKTEVEAELELQISQDALPKPDANSLYMLYFPPGITLTTGGIASCKAWCADHEGFTSQKFGPIYYGMMPDLTKFCGGCNMGKTSFDSLTFVSSHELIEAISDPLCPNIGANGAFPAGWLSKDQNEIGDLCVGSTGHLKSPTGTYFIEGGWDNATGACKGGDFSTQ